VNSPLIEPLGPDQDRDGFDCGVSAQNIYLHRQASQDVRRRVAQVFVALDANGNSVIGYYTLSAASIDRAELPPETAKRLPHYPVPAAILGRLAVERTCQGQRLGEFLLLDALRRVLRVSSALAVHAVVVDAKDEAATQFYGRYGFRAFPGKPLRLFMPVEVIAKSGL
jgi:predicted GNAT family N-acyltransferase